MYDDSAKEKILQAVPSSKIFRVAVSVDGASGTSTNEQLIEKLIQTIEQGSH
jgi:hypothetical protein